MRPFQDTSPQNVVTTLGTLTISAATTSKARSSLLSKLTRGHLRHATREDNLDYWTIDATELEDPMEPLLRCWITNSGLNRIRSTTYRTYIPGASCGDCGNSMMMDLMTAPLHPSGVWSLVISTIEPVVIALTVQCTVQSVLYQQQNLEGTDTGPAAVRLAAGQS